MHLYNAAYRLQWRCRHRQNRLSA